MTPNLEILFARAKEERCEITPDFGSINKYRMWGEDGNFPPDMTADSMDATAKKLTLLANHGHELVEVLDDVREDIEWEAAEMSYQCGLGVGEWEAFIDRTKYYRHWKAITELLTTLEEEAKS